MDKEMATVFIDRRTFAAIERAICLYNVGIYSDKPLSDAGFQNIIIWADPVEQSPIILVAGES